MPNVLGLLNIFTESMVKSNTMNLKDKTFVVYTDGVTEGYLKNGEELGAESTKNHRWYVRSDP